MKKPSLIILALGVASLAAWLLSAEARDEARKPRIETLGVSFGGSSEPGKQSVIWLLEEGRYLRFCTMGFGARQKEPLEPLLFPICSKAYDLVEKKPLTEAK